MLVVVFVGTGCQETKQPAESLPQTPQQSVERQAQVYLKKAYQAYNQEAYRLALALTDSTKKLAPGLTDMHFLRGQIFTALRRFEKADKSYRAVLNQDSTYQGVWLNRGNNAARQGLFKKALVRYKKEMNLYPTALAWVHMGRAYKNLRKPDSARYSYHQALAMDTANANAHIMLTGLYNEAGEPEKALNHAQKALGINPKNLQYRYEVGALLTRAGRAKQALKHLRPVVDKMSFHYGAHYNLGLALQRVGRTEEAQRYLTKADSLQQLHSRLRRLEVAARSNPDNALAWARLGEGLRSINQIEEALQAYNRALTLAPGSVVLQNNVANLSLMQGHLKEAKRRYRAILEQDSTNADIWLNLGVVYARQGSLGAARKAWKTALNHDGDHSTVKTYLAKYASKQ